MNDCKKRIYDKYPELRNKKIYAFFPTWRGVPFSGKYFLHLSLNLKKVADLLNDNEILIIQNHPLVKKAKIKNNNACNLSTVENKIFIDLNINTIDLTILCNVFITDFSSAIFDALCLKKPIFNYIEDLDYVKRNYQFYEAYENYVPGDWLDKHDHIKFVKKIRDSITFVNNEKYINFASRHIQNCDGNSTKRLIEYLK